MIKKIKMFAILLVSFMAFIFLFSYITWNFIKDDKDTCLTIISCLRNPETEEYKTFSGCDYSDAIESGWEETDKSVENCEV